MLGFVDYEGFNEEHVIVTKAIMPDLELACHWAYYRQDIGLLYVKRVCIGVSIWHESAYGNGHNDMIWRNLIKVVFLRAYS